MHAELTAKLHELIGAVDVVGTSGKLVLTLEVRKHKNDTGGVIIIADDIEVKLPKVKSDGSIYFVTPDRSFSKSDPNQSRLSLSVAPPAAPASEIPPAPKPQEIA